MMIIVKRFSVNYDAFQWNGQRNLYRFHFDDLDDNSIKLDEINSKF